MRVVRLARRRWEVRAICSDDGAVLVLDGLRGKNGEKQILSLLLETVPNYGPQVDNPSICKPLKPVSDGLWELRKQPRRGPKPRVIWFKDGDAVVVCTHGFVKDQAKTPRGEIELARKLKREYFETRPTVEELSDES